MVTKELFEKTIADIKKDEGNLKAELNQRQATFDAMARTFQVSVGIFSFLTVLIGTLSFVQFRNDSRVVKLLDKELEDGRRTAAEYRANMQGVTALVATFKNVLDLQQKAGDIVTDMQTRVDEQISKIVTELNREKEHEGELVHDLNERAILLSSKIRRNSVNDTTLKRDTDAFAVKFSNVGDSTSAQGKLNANCYYVLGFHHRIQNDYEAAEGAFEQAIKLAHIHRTEEDARELYPGLPVDKPLSIWLTKLSNNCHYHFAILLYNRGEYELAITHFREALKEDPKDLKSMTYIPEAQFLGRRTEFAGIVREFEDVIRTVKALPPGTPPGFSESRESLLAQAYLKLGNCYMGGSSDDKYREHKDLAKAEQYFREAERLSPTSSVVLFSMAQVLQMRRESGRGMELNGTQNYLERFAAVYQQMKSSVGTITEAKILMMYYYMLAIAATYGHTESEMALVYLMRIQELRAELPKVSGLRIFSPRTKRDCLVGEFLEEAKEFGEVIKSLNTPSGSTSSPASPVSRVRR